MAPEMQVAPKKRGRPRKSEEEKALTKARAKAKRLAMKHVKTRPTAQAPPEDTKPTWARYSSEMRQSVLDEAESGMDGKFPSLYARIMKATLIHCVKYFE